MARAPSIEPSAVTGTGNSASTSSAGHSLQLTGDDLESLMGNEIGRIARESEQIAGDPNLDPTEKSTRLATLNHPAFVRARLLAVRDVAVGKYATIDEAIAARRPTRQGGTG